ncbi:ORF3 [Feline anellovirus]|uniref:ORF3 n=1 Tax=Feline anellovirus TaxID=1861840 RepID=A0A1S5RAQ5_9VIRU|nr:ORF3 [Feline anellovirus]ANK58167.1 ORF3 [Feline anellovirus]
MLSIRGHQPLPIRRPYYKTKITSTPCSIFCRTSSTPRNSTPTRSLEEIARNRRRAVAKRKQSILRRCLSCVVRHAERRGRGDGPRPAQDSTTSTEAPPTPETRRRQVAAAQARDLQLSYLVSCLYPKGGLTGSQQHRAKNKLKNLGF